MDETIIGVILIIILILVIVFASRCFSETAPDVFHDYTYFDYNGTTPPYPEVIKEEARWAYAGNASADYADEARHVIARSDNMIDKWIGLSTAGMPYEKLYTSGASESNNMLIRGVVEAYWLKKQSIPHIIMSSVEHKTSIECGKTLEKLGRTQLTLVPVKFDGSIDLAELASLVKPNTVLISIIHINNELGTIIDMAALGEACASLPNRGQIVLHSDVTQSFGKYPIPMAEWGLDAISMSFHKMYGPAGIGLLALNPQVQLIAQIAGSQQKGLRGGTENLPAIAAIYEAMRITWDKREKKNAHLAEMKKYILDALLQEYNLGNFQHYVGQTDEFVVPLPKGSEKSKEIVPLGPITPATDLPDPQKAAPNTLLLSVVNYGPMEKHFCNIKLRQELLKKGIIISIGSACAAGSRHPSHVLLAIQAPYIIRCGVIRISLGDHTSWHDCRYLVKELIACSNMQG